MYQSVQDAFVPFSTRFEGALPFMYLDVKNLVTTGIGNLIDPLTADVLQLGWQDKDTGAAADEAQITAAWNAVKARTDLSSQGGGAFESVTNLRLPSSAIDQLVQGKLAANETQLKNAGQFADFDNWPADAQLGLLSMAWAMGAGFAPMFPSFSAAAAQGDWQTAAVQSHMNDDHNPGLIPRNAANRVLFSNADWVASQGLAVADLLYNPAISPGDNVKAATAPIPLNLVIGVQAALELLGYDPHGLDDKLGPGTAGALTAFQHDQGLAESGSVDQATRDALGTSLDGIGVPHR